jgi:hypothetical protein
LTLHILPAMDIRRNVFQHDNARPHTARVTVDVLANQNVRMLPGRLNHHNRRILSCGILPILAQETAVVLAELAALVNDCTRVDPNHPTNLLLGSNMVIQTTREHSCVLVG